MCSLKSIEEQWAKVAAAEKVADEQRRMETSPTAHEIADAWIESAMVSSGLVDQTNAGLRNAEEPMRLHSHVPVDFTAIKRPKHAAGDLNTLFYSPHRGELLDVFEDRIRSNPKNSLIRAAAVGLYWQLSQHLPTHLLPMFGWNDSDEWCEYDQTVAVDDPGDNPQRRLFTAILAWIASYGRVHEIVCWEEAHWEILSSFASGDWDRARWIFNHAEAHNLLPKHELRLARLQFEGLLILGPHADRVIKSRDERTTSINWLALKRSFAVSDGVSDKKLSLEKLDVTPDVFRWTKDPGGLSGPERFLIRLPDLQDKAAVVGASSQARIEPLLNALPDDIQYLPDRGVLQRAIAGLLFESMGKNQEAALHYMALATEYDELISKQMALLYMVKAAEQYQQSGVIEQSKELLRRVIAERPEAKFAADKLARLAISLGLIREAEELVVILPEKIRKHFQLLLEAIRLPEKEGASSHMEEVEKQCHQWPAFLRMEITARDSWRVAVALQKSAKELAQLRSQWERVAVQEYGRAVELELQGVFEQFRRSQVNVQNKRGIQSPPSSLKKPSNLEAFVSGKRKIGFLEMEQSLHRGVNAGVIDKRFEQYIEEYHPKLMHTEVLEKLKRLRRSRNKATHETNLLPPSEAQSLAQSIVEAIYY
jgi:tetratricopeptide (TPR) repeat protein